MNWAKHSPEPNRVCRICGKPYYACARCLENKDKNIYGWKLYCDTHECYAIYYVLEGYKDKNFSKEDCAYMLSGRFGDSFPDMTKENLEIVTEIMSIQ